MIRIGTLGESNTYPFRLLGVVLLLTGGVCAAFAAAATWTVVLLLWQGAFTEPPPFGLRLLLKAIFFTAGAMVATVLVFRAARQPPAWAPHAVRPDHRGQPIFWALAAGVALAAALFLPNLDRFPWPAPDELHHLIVARNLAQHGAYASGMPPDALVHFDHYDSVGAPVIAPVGLAFALFGASLETARAVMGTFGLLLVPLAYAALRAAFSRSEALAGAGLSLAAFGTIYLGRTLYGELPALVFMLGGLLLWRRGLTDESRAIPLLFAAGVLFGLCALTKTFMLVCAFAFVGVWLYDRATFRRIPHRAVLVPALALALVMVAWQAYEALSSPAATDRPSTLLYYRHSLIFGWEALVQPRDRWLDWFLPVLLAVFALSHGVPRVFRERYDPPLAVLFLIAPLFAFWWLFFTPHHIYRYLWYSGVIAAMFTGPFALACFRVIARSRHAVRPRVLAAAAAVALIFFAYAPRLVEKGWYVLSNDQAAPDRALAGYVEKLPRHTRIATTYWPAERWINFTSQREVHVLFNPDAAAASHDVLIHSERVQSLPPPISAPAQRFGHYVIYRPARYQAAERFEEAARP